MADPCIQPRLAIINTARFSILAFIFFISVVLDSAASNGQEDFSIGGNSSGQSLASFRIPLSKDEGNLQVTFDFGANRGFLGPSTDPASQSGFSNADRTLFAVNNAPMTKLSYVHLFLRSQQGDFLFLNDVNSRVASLLSGRFAKSAKYFLRVESVKGRQVHLQTIDFSTRYIGGPDRAPRHNFVISVDSNGFISLTKGAANNPEEECSGILHGDQYGLRLGGGIGEGEGICVIAKSERHNVLTLCSIGHFCRLRGHVSDCKDSGECVEIRDITSMSKH